MIRVIALASLLYLAGPVCAQITPDDAFRIARAEAIRQDPGLSSASTVVSTATTDCIAVQVSCPNASNGTLTWYTYCIYQDGRTPVVENTGLGGEIYDLDASASQGSQVPADLLGEVQACQAAWHLQPGVDEMAAHRTRAYLYWFHSHGFGGYALVGVDGDGKLFNPNPSHPLFPWHDSSAGNFRRQSTLLRWLSLRRPRR